MAFDRHSIKRASSPRKRCLKLNENLVCRMIRRSDGFCIGYVVSDAVTENAIAKGRSSFDAWLNAEAILNPKLLDDGTRNPKYIELDD